jgi:hypothetical protein
MWNSDTATRKVFGHKRTETVTARTSYNKKWPRWVKYDSQRTICNSVDELANRSGDVPVGHKHPFLSLLTLEDKCTWQNMTKDINDLPSVAYAADKFCRLQREVHVH